VSNQFAARPFSAFAPLLAWKEAYQFQSMICMNYRLPYGEFVCEL